MPYFHSTTADRLASIRQFGLGGIDPGPRSVPCDRGVYLAGDPELALCMSLEHVLGGDHCAETPPAALAALRVIVVDDARIDPARLAPDPHLPAGWNAWRYDGVLDVGNARVLTAEEVLRGAAS